MLHEDAVRSELERVVTHDVFGRARRMRTLLRYLVDEELAGNGEQLKGYRIGVDALGRGADFDPSVDSLVRVEMGRLRRMLDAVYEGGAAPLRICFDKGTYRPRFEQEHGRASSPVVRPAAVGIVLLPVAGAHGDPALGAGLHHGLMAELSRYETLRVLDGGLLEGREAAERLRLATDELGCHYLLDGRLQQDGSRFRLLLDVRDATDGAVVWTGRHEGDRGHAELLEFLRATARDLARLVSRQTETQERAPAGAPPLPERSAECLLKWHGYRARDRSAEANAELETLVRSALAAEPGFLPGWVIRAHLAVDRRAYLLADPDQLETLIEESAFLSSRAVSLDGSSAAAWHVLALHHRFLGDASRFPELLTRAIGCNPEDPELLHHGGAVLAFSGSWDEGERLVARAGYPVDEGPAYRLFHVYRCARAGDLEQALALLDGARGGYGHIVPLTEAVLRGGLGDRTGGRARLDDARAMNARIDAAGAREQIELWFGDDVLRGTLLGGLEALA